MRLNHFTITKQIIFGFGIVLALLIAVGIMTYIGVGGIVRNANKVINGNRLQAEFNQRWLEHIAWKERIEKTLSGESGEGFSVESADPQICDFGHWYHGEGRKKTEALLPSLKPLLDQIEAPHAALHKSVVETEKVFKPANHQLPVVLSDIQVSHMRWVIVARNALAEKKKSLEVQLDPSKCEMGKWLESDDAKKSYENGSSEYRKAFDEILLTHKRLHETGRDIEVNMVFEEERAIDLKLYKLKQSFSTFTMDLVNEINKVTQERIALSVCIDIFHELQMASLAFSSMTPEEFDNPWIQFNLHNDKLQKGLLRLQVANSEKEESTTATNNLVELSSKWFRGADEYHDALQAKIVVAQKTERAQRIFNGETRSLLNNTMKLLDIMKKEAVMALTGYDEAMKIYQNQIIPITVNLGELFNKLGIEARKSSMTNEAMLKEAEKTKWQVSVMVFIAFFTGITLAFFIARRISIVLFSSSSQVNEGAIQVAAISNEVYAASGSLAQGVTEQATRIEETSASLENMAFMTRQNAEHAAKADTLMQETRHAVAKANAIMQELNTAMGEVSKSSADTSKIVRTIDEIAFQTNLLALNAAVEAARAGEAGSGFAVVADEVRNLAMRAAGAAHTTTNLIEETIKKVNTGAALVQKTNESFSSMERNTEKVGQLIAEIATASNEQSIGIEQINKAMEEMDKVVQKNASHAEESVASSAELRNQAEQMKDGVGELARLVGNYTLSPQTKAISMYEEVNS